MTEHLLRPSTSYGHKSEAYSSLELKYPNKESSSILEWVSESANEVMVSFDWVSYVVGCVRYSVSSAETLVINKIGIHLNLIFPIQEQNFDKYTFKALISKKCPGARFPGSQSSILK